jgi:peroxiredoxin Q/BCP
MIALNSPAPDFELKDETGVVRRLADYSGKEIVLYFYPADDTPGCTKEACAFRDDYSAYTNSGVTILGVSPDSPESHVKFKQKYGLPFPLLADENHAVCERYNVWGEKSMMGKKYMGVIRTTFIIDASGNIKKIFENIKPSEHSKDVLDSFK